MTNYRWYSLGIDHFTVEITDVDIESTIEQGYYLAVEKSITDIGWKSNGTYGFIHDDLKIVNTTLTNQAVKELF